MPCCFFFWPFKHFGLTAKQANPLTVDAIVKFPKFAPFYLCLGDIYCDQKDEAKALATYREGLQLVAKAMAALIRTM